MKGSLSMSGHLRTRLMRAPKAPLAWRVRTWLRWAYIYGYWTTRAVRLYSRVTGIATFTSELRARLIRADGDVINYGVLARRVVTTAFVNFLVDNLIAETAEFGDFKFHDSGIGTTAENAADTGIETSDGEARASGSQEEGASANIYKSIGTISYTTTKAITEHGLFSHLTAGTLLDRSVFTAINVINGDSIQFTYELTVNSGG